MTGIDEPACIRIGDRDQRRVDVERVAGTIGVLFVQQDQFGTDPVVDLGGDTQLDGRGDDVALGVGAIAVDVPGLDLDQATDRDPVVPGLGIVTQDLRGVFLHCLDLGIFLRDDLVLVLDLFFQCHQARLDGCQFVFDAGRGGRSGAGERCRERGGHCCFLHW